ncbi:KPN_02809 family neutral zinc metallopeptidase [Oryzibacter oryziterrae]|uniref:KPN_02809 family neutral zinc metallopeptidase n=1 Tax=Oryzibacter oryziterrae TaxID=2766474 RepID=UPI001F2C6ABF|nr:neutral zinc metallopeptidase [Oryzibacter oryziterrae]
MRWQGRRQSDNVEDYRDGGGSQQAGGGFRLPGGNFGGGGRRGGGLSIGTLIVLGVILWMLGINPLVLLDGNMNLTGTDSFQQQRPQQSSNSNDEMKQFVATVLADTEDTWTEIFKASGEHYKPTPLVLFSRSLPSACGFASAASGPFYCPGDKKIYIDLAFYQELRQKFDAPGDFAQAYVIAHEVGHHVQDLLGILPDFNRKRQAMSQSDSNAYSVRIELQADCFAGVWGAYAQQKGILERGDLEEALNAAVQIGDDTIQKRMQGYVVPESFNHGTSAQRKRWFAKGFDAGSIDACDTLAAKTL